MDGPSPCNAVQAGRRWESDRSSKQRIERQITCRSRCGGCLSPPCPSGHASAGGVRYRRAHADRDRGIVRATLRRLLIPIAILVVVGFAVTVANQTAQVVALAGRASPWLGQVVLWLLVTLYGLCIAVPVYVWARLPSALRPPHSESDPEFPKHVARLTDRLRANRHLQGRSIANRQDIEAALPVLDSLADEKLKAVAKQVFLTTAVSQNGSLDTFLVLTAQSKLVLEVARVYYQRPSLRDLTYLYANVAGTAFVAGELEDLDLAEQLQPVLAAAFGSAAGAVPGLGAATSLFVNSVTTGAANAFLTLRVGIIAKQYCRAVVIADRRTLRRAAILQATQLLGGVVLDGTKRVAAAVGTATKRTVGGAIERFGDQIKGLSTGVRDRSLGAMSRFKRQRDGLAIDGGAEGIAPDE
jgi:hypothetical protein